MATRLRDVDAVGRWGDRELAFLLPHTTGEQARVAIERLCALLESRQERREAAIRKSIGIAQYREDDNAHTLLARAGSAAETALHSDS